MPAGYKMSQKYKIKYQCVSTLEVLIVMVAAMNTQRKADYIVALIDNHKTLHEYQNVLMIQTGTVLKKKHYKSTIPQRKDRESVRKPGVIKTAGTERS